MARDYANLRSAVWADQDFRELSMSSQWAFMMLISQPNISSAGVLPLARRRWAGYAKNLSSSTIGDALKELGHGNFILVDEDAEEVLVRSFVKWDRGYMNSKRLPAILSDTEAIHSAQLRNTVIAELTKLNVKAELPALTDSPSDALSDSPSDSPSFDWGDDPPCAIPTSADSPRYLNLNRNQNQNLNLEEAPSAQPRVRPILPSHLEAAFGAFWAAYPRHTAKLDAQRKFVLAARRVDPQEIVTGAVKFAKAVKGTEERFIPHPATWLNQGRWTDDQPSAQAKAQVVVTRAPVVDW